MIVHGFRSPRHLGAYMTVGFPGMNSRSAAPVLSEMNSTFRQVLPPSVVFNTPRSWFGLKALPMAATYTTLGFDGSMRTAPIWPASYKPAKLHVWPPSVVLYTPRPVDTLLRMSSEPVPR